jgi:Gluconate 2-dehydrogenase subunit 3
MNRRDLIKQIALLTGTAVIGGDFFLSGCKTNSPAEVMGLFSEKDISFFDEIAETIIPKTNTPGAKDAEVGKFMALYSTDCYDEKELKLLREGLGQVDGIAGEMYQVSFMKSTAEQKQAILSRIDAEAKKYQAADKGQGKAYPPHYFTLMKQLVLLGFFTSRPGATQVLHYVPTPGKYEGCIDYKAGDTSWA